MGGCVNDWAGLWVHAWIRGWRDYVIAGSQKGRKEKGLKGRWMDGRTAMDGWTEWRMDGWKDRKSKINQNNMHISYYIDGLIGFNRQVRWMVHRWTNRRANTESREICKSKQNGLTQDRYNLLRFKAWNRPEESSFCSTEVHQNAVFKANFMQFSKLI